MGQTNKSSQQHTPCLWRGLPPDWAQGCRVRDQTAARACRCTRCACPLVGIPSTTTHSKQQSPGSCMTLTRWGWPLVLAVYILN